MNDLPEKTSLGVQENVARLLCYVLGWVSGLILLLIVRENKNVRFHAIQSIVVFGAITIASYILGLLPYIGGFLGGLLGLLAFVLWIILMVKAYQQELFRLPVAGDLADKWAG
jgi:uncharacterized membrane protein